MYPLRALFMVGLLLGSMAVIIPDNASAATSYYFTFAPTANNATLTKEYARVTYGPSTESTVMAKNDSLRYTLYESTVTEEYPQITFDLNDFTDPDWVAYDPAPTGVVGYMPWDNGTATIDRVCMMFVCTYPNPDFTIKYSIDGGSTWGDSFNFPKAYFYGTFQLDVTEEEVWTPAILNSDDLCIRCYPYPEEKVYAYIDYIGWYVEWSVPYSGGADSGTWGESWSRTDLAPSPGWDFITDTNGVVYLLGIFGLVGMIAAPALGIFAYRANPDEGKMRMFIKMLVLFMFCLTAFMYSITAG